MAPADEPAEPDAEATAPAWVLRLGRLPAWVLPAASAGAALLIRIWTLLEQRAANPLFRTAILDDRFYLDLAGGVPGGPADDPAWFLAPLYPWVLGIATQLGAVEMGTASAVSVLFGVATAAAVAVAARTLHSDLAGWLAGLLYAAAGTFVFHDVLPGQEPILCAVHALALVFAARFLRDGSWLSAGLLGATVGIAMLGRSTSAVLVAAGEVAQEVFSTCHFQPGQRLQLAGIDGSQPFQGSGVSWIVGATLRISLRKNR